MIRIRHDNDTGFGDLVLGDFGLESDDGLETAVYISLFTDARAEDSEEISDGTNDPRGCWIETYGYPLGSKLWLLHRSKTTPDTLRKAQQYAQESLRWMIQSNAIKSVTVTATRTEQDWLLLTVTVTRPDGSQWARQWNAQGELRG